MTTAMAARTGTPAGTAMIAMSAPTGTTDIKTMTVTTTRVTGAVPPFRTCSVCSSPLAK